MTFQLCLHFTTPKLLLSHFKTCTLRGSLYEMGQSNTWRLKAIKPCLVRHYGLCYGRDLISAQRTSQNVQNRKFAFSSIAVLTAFVFRFAWPKGTKMSAKHLLRQKHFVPLMYLNSISYRKTENRTWFVLFIV